ncbi:MAG: hypothetical protein ACX93N_13750 [Pseudohaliea sp.]
MILLLIWYLSFLGLCYWSSKIDMPVLFLLAFFLVPLIFPIQLARRIPGLWREASVNFEEEAAELLFDGEAFPLSHLKWYRLDVNGHLAHQLVLGFRDEKRLHISTWADDSDSNKKLHELYARIKKASEGDRLEATSYYAGSSWQVLKWILLGTLPIAWSLPLIVSNTGPQLISALGVWSGVVLSFVVVVQSAHRGRKTSK